MKLWIVIPSALIVIWLCGFQTARASPPGQVALADGDRQNERAVLKHLWPVLKSSGKVARIYYRAACQPEEDHPVVFPKIDVQPPSRGETGLVAIRDIFRNNRNVTVTGDDTGIIRIRIGQFPDTILQTRIATLAFDPISQYNYMLALDAIEMAPEVQSAMSKLNIHVPSRVYNMLTVQPAESLPHLPYAITNVSMDQTLDSVARAFKGIVFYGACQRPHLYELDFAVGVYFDESTL